MSGSSGPPGSEADCTIERASGDVTPIPVQADGRLQDAEVTLDVSWNAQTQPTLNGDGDPPTGDRWMVVVASVSNPSDSEVELGTFQLTTETESTVREDKVNGVTLIGDSDVANRQLEDVILKANGETTGLLIYGVRADVTAATFGVEDASSFAFEPTCDEELRVDVPL